MTDSVQAVTDQTDAKKKGGRDDRKKVGKLILTREIRALATNLSANFRSVNRTYIFLLTTFVVTNSLAASAAHSSSTTETASIFGVSLNIDVFIPISICVMCLIAWNYCLCFNQAFRAAGAFLECEFDIFEQRPTIDATMSGVPTNHFLHSLYEGTFFRVFPLTAASFFS